MNLNSSKKFCLSCAKKSFSIWKGWPKRDVVNWPLERQEMANLPQLNTLKSKNCSYCRDTESLDSSLIYYLNIHEDGNTGLPDYFVLKIDNSSGCEDSIRLRLKWGIPYDQNQYGTIHVDELQFHVKKHFQD